MSAIDVWQGGAVVDELHHIDRGWACIEDEPAQGGMRVRGVST